MAASSHPQFAANAALGLSHSVGYAPQRPFLSELAPGLSRSDLADAIVGNISAKIKCSKSALDVLRVLICYTRGSHDRVWTSYVRIMKRAEKYIPGWRKCSLKTIQRNIHFWIKAGVIRRIDDPTEKFSGPGEHLWVDEGNEKQGDGPVNHYCNEGLKAFVPAWCIQAFEALIGGGHFTPPPAPEPFKPIDVEAEMGDPFDEAQEPARQAKKDAREKKRRSKIGFRALVTRSAAARAENDLTDTTADTDGDFADPFSDLAENSSDTVQACAKSTAPNLMGMTLDISRRRREEGSSTAESPRNVEMSQKNSNENGAEKPSSQRPSEVAVDVTKLSAIGARYEGAPAGANTTANERSQAPTEKPKKAPPQWVAKQPREVQELDRKGVNGYMARKIYNEMGDAWVRAVLVYGRKQEGRDNDRKGGPWYVEVYKGFRDATPDKPASFPDDDKVDIDRNERAHNEAQWAAERAALLKQQQPEPPPSDAAREIVVPCPISRERESVPGWIANVPEPVPTGMVGTGLIPPTPIEPPKAPEPLAGNPSPELAAVWPAVLKEAETCFNRGFWYTHVKTLTPGAYTKPEADPGKRGVVTLITDGQFTYGSWNEKPQHRRTLTSLLAEKLGVEAGQLTLAFTPVRGGR